MDSVIDSAPTVSVIMPIYNRRNLIERAIRSLLNQSFHNYELLICDDGSTDHIEEIIFPLLEQHHHFRYCRFSHRGVAAARNIGIYGARGHYVTFLDADDEYLSQHLQLRLQIFKANPTVDVIHGGVILRGDPDSFWVPDADRPQELIHLDQCCIGATIFAPRHILVHVGGFPQVDFSAESRLLRMLESRFSVLRIDYPTYVYYTGLADSVCTRGKYKG